MRSREPGGNEKPRAGDAGAGLVVVGQRLGVDMLAVLVEVELDVSDFLIDLIPRFACCGPGVGALDVIIPGIEFDGAEGVDEVVESVVGGIVAFSEHFAGGSVVVNRGKNHGGWSLS